jgi:hypothetical protein
LTPTPEITEVLARVREVARRELGWTPIGYGELDNEVSVWSFDPRRWPTAVFFDYREDEVGTASSREAARHWARSKTPPREPGEWISSPSYEAAFHPVQPPSPDPDDPRVLALLRACPGRYSTEKARRLVGSWDHLGVRADWDVQRGEKERFVRAHGIRAWADVTAALVDASRVQVDAESVETAVNEV